MIDSLPVAARRCEIEPLMRRDPVDKPVRTRRLHHAEHEEDVARRIALSGRRTFQRRQLKQSHLTTPVSPSGIPPPLFHPRECPAYLNLILNNGLNGF